MDFSFVVTALAFFVAILLLLVLSHELGHFVAARLSGVKIHELGFGYPPRLFSIKRGETEYSLNLLPLGGFVRLVGEEDPREPGSLAGKSIPLRLLVLSAGSIMNALLPILLFSASFAIPKEIVTGQVAVNKVTPGSPAEKAGIQANDIILKINDRTIKNVREVSYNVHLNLGSEIRLVLRSGRFAQREVRLVPRWNPPPGEGPTGVMVSMANVYLSEQAYPIWEAVPLGVLSTMDSLTLAKNEIMTWFVQSTAPQLAGPIGIAQMTGQVAELGGIASLLDFAALLSINLAVLNMLPIPMLDGGRLFFVVLEGLRGGKRIPPDKEGFVHMVGFALIMALVIIISYYDILRIVQGKSPFP
ncbi:MAG: site-2 protease family protein [Chloroflexi bacterium]|nr:site-2 protease family protein [Chloroflexota bacterium]